MASTVLETDAAEVWERQDMRIEPPSYTEVISLPPGRLPRCHISGDLQSPANGTSTLTLVREDSEEATTGGCGAKRLEKQLTKPCGIGCGVAMLLLLAGLTALVFGIQQELWNPYGWVGIAFFAGGLACSLFILSYLFYGWCSDCACSAHRSNMDRAENMERRVEQLLASRRALGWTNHSRSPPPPARISVSTLSGAHPLVLTPTLSPPGDTYISPRRPQPPPSYDESEAISDSLRLALEQTGAASRSSSRPPSYRSRSSTLQRSAIADNSQLDPQRSRPPSYRSRSSTLQRSGAVDNNQSISSIIIDPTHLSSSVIDNSQGQILNDSGHVNLACEAQAVEDADQEADLEVERLFDQITILVESCSTRV